jgi:hypothetical protein
MSGRYRLTLNVTDDQSARAVCGVDAPQRQDRRSPTARVRASGACPLLRAQRIVVHRRLHDDSPPACVDFVYLVGGEGVDLDNSNSLAAKRFRDKGRHGLLVVSERHGC